MTDEQHMHLDDFPQTATQIIHLVEILRTLPNISLLLKKTCGNCAEEIFNLELKDLENLVAITKKCIAVRYKVLEKSL